MANPRILIVWNTVNRSLSRFGAAERDLSIEHIDFTCLPTTTPSAYDGIVLTGTDVSPAVNYPIYSKEVDFVMSANCPVLAICGGFQILMSAVGAPITIAPKPVYGRVNARIEGEHNWLAGMPNSSVVFAKHRWQVPSAPPQYRILARSADLSAVYAVAHLEKPIVGVQFHPERGSDGARLLSNFLAHVAAKGGNSEL